MFYMFSKKVRRSIGNFFLPLWFLRWLQSYDQNCEFRRIVFIQYHNTDHAFFWLDKSKDTREGKRKAKLPWKKVLYDTDDNKSISME